MPFFEYHGAKMHYVDIDQSEEPGNGLPLVFIHGAGSSMMIWTLQLLEFRKRHRVIALDLYGHGDSEDIERPPDIEKGFSRQLAALLEHLELQEYVLIGHSMGGGVVMSYALENRDPRPSALVLVGTSSDLDLSKIALGLAIEAFEDHSPKYDIKDLDDDFKVFSLVNFQQNATKFQANTILKDLQACNNFDITPRLNEITIPSLVLVGEDDDIITPRRAKQLEMALPRAEFAIVRGSDHSPMVESPDIFNDILNKFLHWVEKNGN
ncbi:MAG: alpha/beta fold hydrolase [Candidatus Thorarchaeota archaeon]